MVSVSYKTHFLHVPPYFHRLAGLYWLPSPSVTLRLVSAHPSIPACLVGTSFGSFLGGASPSPRLSHPAALSLMSRRAVLLEKPFFQPHIITAFIFFGIIMNCGLICSPGWSPGRCLMNSHPFDAEWFPQEFMFPLQHSACVFVLSQDAPAASQLCFGSTLCLQQVREILGQKQSAFAFLSPFEVSLPF